jgi:Holliday junction resolvase
MPINSREKGKRGERELANILHGYGYETRRGQQYSGTETTADIIGLPGIHPEVKRVENLNIYAAVEQAVRDADESKDIPAVFHRRNNKEWLVTMRLIDWLTMYRATEGGAGRTLSSAYRPAKPV